jgi:hemolysin III
MAVAGANKHRSQTRGEEVANAISHGVGVVAALIALPLLMWTARSRGALAVIGAAVFGTSVVVLYSSSAIYHALAPNRAKAMFRIIDHSAIYFLIAGTYTPFTLGVLHGPWGWTLFGVVWGLAAFGVVMKTTIGVRYDRLSTALYLAMGWLALIAVKQLWMHLPPWGLVWLVAGGLSYTVGVKFYSTDHHPYRHFVWHLFVLAGTTCHFVAVWRYAV